MTLYQLKKQIHSLCLHHLATKLEEGKHHLRQLKEAAHQDTKSSMGDKYETGPALLQQEKDKINAQLMQVSKMQEVLHRIDPEKQPQNVSLGSLIETNTGYYFISVGIGKITYKEYTCFCISLASPLGQALVGHQAGDNIPFRNQSIHIKSLN